MAEIAKLDIDPTTGLIRSGRFVGRSTEEVMQYLEHLEQAAASDDRPAPETPENKTPLNPTEELTKRTAPRVDAFQQLTLATTQRLIADDEEAFAKTVPDYEQYRERIAKAKATMHPMQQVQPGLHKQAYLFLKGQEPTHQARMLGQEEPVLEETPEETPAVPVVEAPPAPVVVVAKPAPKAVPSARPTPAARVVPPAPEKKSALKSTPKVERIAAAMGMSLDAYLLKLEAQGVTQDQLNTNSAAAQSAQPRRKSIYDHV